MKITLLLLILALNAPGAEPGFQPLFDGSTLQGWTVLPGKRPSGAWVVESGMLKPEGRPGNLATEGVYGDFELRLEWKIAKLGNSGIFYRVPPADNPSGAAVEYQLADNEREASRKHANRKSGAAYGLYAPKVDASNAPGEWNTLRIVARGDQLQHWLNGRKVAEFDLASDDFRARVASSKFSKNASFARARSGRIVLQDHASAVWFRNIRIRPFGASR